MEEQAKTSETSMEEKQTMGRRELLKALAAGGGAVAASAVVSGKWVKPVVEAGVLPAHAATSVLTYFQIFNVTSGEIEPLGDVGDGPSAMKVTVEGSTAYVEANNGSGRVRLSGSLDIDGTPKPAADFNIEIGTGCKAKIPASSWNVEGYSFGDPTISIRSSEGRGSGWTATAPQGSGNLPDLLSCEFKGD
jgi:hypothetical protein